MKRAKTIYKKEIVDTLRDRRTLAMMLLVPMVGYPLTLLLTTETIATQQRESAARTVRVIAANDVPGEVVRALYSETGLQISSADVPTSTAARGYLEDGSIDVLIARDPKQARTATGTTELLLYYDVTGTHAESAISRVEDSMMRAAVKVRDARLKNRGLDPAIAEPISIERRSIATDTEVGNQLAASILPALVVLFIAIACFYPAVDLTAGEKERKTLATLLCAPISPIDIVAGKYLAVLTVGMLAGVLNVGVLALTMLRVIAGGAAQGSAPQLAIGPLTMLGLAVGVVMVALPIAALMMLVGTLARSFRDASSLLTPVLLLASVPAILASFPGSELTPLSAVIPLANAALLMKALILERAELGTAMIAAVSTLTATALLLLFAARTFADERVLFSTEGKRADLKSVLFSPPPIGVSTALAFSAIAFIASYYAGLLAIGRTALTLVFVSQLASFVVPTLVLAWWLKPVIAPRELLKLKRPGVRGTLSAIVLGAGAWLGVSLPIAWITERILPGQQKAAEAFERALGLSDIPVPMAILAFAVLPAVAEELAVRGAVYSLLSKSVRPIPALIGQALIFGAMHGSIYRLLPTAALGLLLGVLAKKSRSIVPGMIAHAMTNSILLLVSRYAPEDLGQQLGQPTPLAIAGVLLVVIALVIRSDRHANLEAPGRHSDQRG